MAALFQKLRDRSPNRASADLSPQSPESGSIFASLNPIPTTQVNGSFSPPHSPQGHPRSRNTSRSPPDHARSGSAGLAPFPTPFHAFKLNPVSTKNQVNALKFIDRLDSLLFLGHPAATIFAALPSCMANAEAQAWFSRIQNSDIHKPVTLDDFRQCLINDHIWAFEQNRIMSRYQSRSAGNRRDPYLDSAEFKLHLAYIRDAVRLEEQVIQKEKKLAAVYDEMSAMQEKESAMQKKISALQYEMANRESSASPQQQQVAPLNSAAAIINSAEMDEMKGKVAQMERIKSAMTSDIAALQNSISSLEQQKLELQNNISSLEQQKLALNGEISNLRAKVIDLEASNSRLRSLADAVPSMQARIGELEARNMRMQQHIDSTPTPPPGQDMDIQRLREQNTRFMTQLNQKDSQVAELESQLKTRADTAQKHQQEAQTAQDSQQQLQQQIQTLMAQNQLLQQQLQQAQQQSQQQQQQLQQAQQEKQQQQQQQQQATAGSSTSPPYPYGATLTEATRSMDDAFSNMNLSNANLEAIIKQKDEAISDLHGRIGKLTDEAINRVQRVFQIEQSLIDSHAISRTKDMALFSLERRLAGLGHAGDCACQNCSQFPKSGTPAPPQIPQSVPQSATSTSSNMFKGPVHTNSAPIASGVAQFMPPQGHHASSGSFDLAVASAFVGNAGMSNAPGMRASLMGRSPSMQPVSANVSRTSTPMGQPQLQQIQIPQQQQQQQVQQMQPPPQPQQQQQRRFLDIRFKYGNPAPQFVPVPSQAAVSQLLHRGITVMHPGADFKGLWENISKGLLETLGGDLGLMGEVTKHLKLSFRDDNNSSASMYTGRVVPKGLVVADVWFEVWQEINGLDIVCDF